MKLKLLAILLLFAVGGVALVVTLGGLPRSAAAATTYLTSTAEVADVSDDVAATGSVESTTSWNLAFGEATTQAPAATDSSSTSSASGQDTGTWTVKAVSVKVGDIVKKDQVLATGANPDLTASIAAAKNDWTSARLNQLQAQDAYDDATETAQIRQTRSALLNATNQVASAKQTYNDLRATATHNRLVAPAAGIVTGVNVTQGADAPSGTAITIASTDYEVTASVVENDVPSLKLDQAATVAVSALGAELTGKVTAIAPTATTSTSSGSVVSFAVTVALTNPPATLRPGMTADVTITTASASGVLAVPAAAIRGTADNYSVLVLTAAGTPEAKPVTVGLMTSSLVEVTSGLNQGDVVVTGTSSTQRTTTGTGGGGFQVPTGGGGFRGGPGN